MLRIEFPFHGAILNWRNAERIPEGLRIRVEGIASLGSEVKVNGKRAERKGERFYQDILLKDREEEIVALAKSPYGEERHSIKVIWDINSKPRYRFTIDDNIFFLKDIAQKGYPSLFDCFYLKGLRELHRKYGTKFALNIFYASEDGFTLSQFPDKYKEEWKDNSHWLKLSFHAYKEFPDRPYQYAPFQKLAQDFDKVREEIIRFAGEETYAPTTVVHWGMVPPEGLKVLKERGVKALSGYFIKTGAGWDVNYLLDDIRSEYLSRHDALMDWETGIVFSRIDLICNLTPSADIPRILNSLAGSPQTAEIMDLLTHEQYFWKFYSNFIPDHFERLETAIRWVTEHDYEPVFLHDGFLGI
ncbi:hypothetical protein J7K43_04150 [Candidatus Calescamantes bacterium]|nr:hypothetical protein [Candidatus Calescamantes bacterium]